MGLAIVTNQQINHYYDLYRENEIVFTKDILRSLRVDPRQIYVKCSGAQWPCIINSTSFQMAKIIIGTSGGAFRQITHKDAPPVNLCFCFIEQDNKPLNFFVLCRVTNVTPYMNSQELAIVTLTFTQRPPDDLIYKIGSLIDANESFTRRKEERITLNENVQKRIGLDKKESIVYIQNVPQRCILWDISFSGAQVVITGQEQYLKGKDAIIRFAFTDPQEMIDVKGTIVAVRDVEGRTGIVTVSLKFDENQVPLAYKLRINDYLTYNRKKFLEATAHVPQTEAKN